MTSSIMFMVASLPTQPISARATDLDVDVRKSTEKEKQMKRLVYSLAVILSTSCLAIGQGQQPSPQTVSLSVGLQRSYDSVKTDLTRAADKMHEADFSYRPTPEIRPFGQLFTHVASSQFAACAWIKGESNPRQESDFEKMTTKADILRVLAESFTYCDSVFSAITDEGLTKFITRGKNQGALGWAVTSTLEHDNEMYGTACVYLRLKGIVPPSTEVEQQRRRMSK
jgi:hypothetical protein